MYTIHQMKKGMRRTQLYLDEEMAKTLEILNRLKGMTVSELVRTGLRQRDMPNKDLNEIEIARGLTGNWRDRKDRKEIDAVVRRLRKGTRLKGVQIS